MPRPARRSSPRAPQTANCSARFPGQAPEDVDRAVAAAKESYETWRLVPAPKRGEILFRFAHLVEEHKAELTDLMAHEMGKVRAEAGGDVQEAIDMSYYMAGEGRRLFGQTTPSELRDKFNMSVRHADRRGRRDHALELPDCDPVLEDRAGARLRQHRRLQAGDRHAGCSGERFVELLVEAGVPPGVVNVVHGGGAEVGDRLVRHPDVPVITLTGSRETGVAVMRNRRRPSQARPPRARRQERDHRARRRRPRPRGRGHPLVGLRDVAASAAPPLRA